MRTKKNLLPLLVVLIAALWIGGCSENPTKTIETDTVNLVDEFGGYTTAAEQVAFGDDELLADDELEVEIDDPLLGSPEITALTSDPESGMFHLRAIWGQMPCDTTATDPIDWTGSLTITRGAEVVRRLIRFEPTQDYLLERTDRKLIEWVSQTTIHNDGIVVDLFVPPPELILDSTEIIDTSSTGDITITYVVDTLPVEPVTVTFATGPYTRTFTLADLAALDEIIELENGASVAFHAMQVFRVQCPSGFVIGGWGHNDEGQGRFRGRLMSNRGEITGWLNGHFGQNEDGEDVLFGKWINRNGQCEGFLKGQYEPTRHRNGDLEAGHRYSGGEFHGRIFDAERNEIGRMHGQYQSAQRRQNGFFQGRWRLGCGYDRERDQDGVHNYDNGFDEII